MRTGCRPTSKSYAVSTLLTAIEGMKPPGGGPSSVGFWGGAAWFVVPHLDVRADWVRRSTGGSLPTNTFLIQINGYL